MYKVKLKGINIKDNERVVSDGFLKESINLQWKDGSYRPIPERLKGAMNVGSTGIYQVSNYIFHKVSDEDNINVLAFVYGNLVWFGTIENADYTVKNPIVSLDFPEVTDFDSFSFTILNGLIYFMSSSQEFYYRVQFNETDGVYEVKDMYAWKSLIPYYPIPNPYKGAKLIGTNTSALISQCGVILIRYTLVLNTGEEVLHTPIYAYYMYAVNTSASAIKKNDTLKNIHTIINTNLDFLDTELLSEEVSAINVYASIPYYLTEVGDDTIAGLNTQRPFDSDDIKGQVQIMADSSFYLVKTLENPTDSDEDETIMFYVGDIITNLFYYKTISPLVKLTTSKIDANSIAAGSVMPADNFSYHKIFGTITSINGRLIISNPKTVLSNGHIRALSLSKNSSREGYYINTEDGDLKGVSYDIDTAISGDDTSITSRGILSYPDSRASYVGGNRNNATSGILLYKTRANKSHNLSCAYNFEKVTENGISTSIPSVYYLGWEITPSATIEYNEADLFASSNQGSTDSLKYTSNNRIQFSEAGEFSVWPAINSYRVGDGKIVFVGSNNIDPSNVDYISLLLIGTTDGIYTANFDSSGEGLIQSITRAANLPAISKHNIAIDQNLVYASDKGLIIINNGQVDNITEDFFPEYGDGSFPDDETVYPNYSALTPTLKGDDYKITDIIDYMEGALFAYDGRRNNLWCSNPDKLFSLIYNIESNQWTKSTYVFNEVISFNDVTKSLISENKYYSRFLTRNKSGAIDILSGEDMDTLISVLLLTRSIKMQTPDQFKKIEGLTSRCELYKGSSSTYFTFGVWGKQDVNKDKVNIPLIAIKDYSSASFPNNIRQDIPIGRMKGKYKIITILQGGKILPSSSIDGFEIVAIPVENNILR